MPSDTIAANVAMLQLCNHDEEMWHTPRSSWRQEMGSHVLNRWRLGTGIAQSVYCVGHWLDDFSIGILLPAWTRYFLISLTVPRPIQPPFKGNHRLFPLGQRAGTWNRPSSIINNARNYTSTTSYSFLAWYLSTNKYLFSVHIRFQQKDSPIRSMD